MRPAIRSIAGLLICGMLSVTASAQSMDRPLSPDSGGPPDVVLEPPRTAQIEYQQADLPLFSDPKHSTGGAEWRAPVMIRLCLPLGGHSSPAGSQCECPATCPRECSNGQGDCTPASGTETQAPAPVISELAPSDYSPAPLVDSNTLDLEEDQAGHPQIWQPQLSGSIAEEPPSHTTASEAPLSEDVLELARIRERLQLEPLAGTIFDQTGAGALQFAQAVAALAAERAASPPPAPVQTAPEAWETVDGGFARTAYSGDYIADYSGDYVTGQVPGHPESNTVAQLRFISRQLEEQAAVLEEQNCYGRADELRELADEVRQQARMLRAESPTP